MNFCLFIRNIVFLKWFYNESCYKLCKYRIESLSAATFHGALKVLKESFCQDESVCVGVEINKNEQAIEEFLEMCANIALDGVSLVAVHIETREVAAIAFNELQTTTKNPSKQQFSKIFAKRITQDSIYELFKWVNDIHGRSENFFEKFDIDCKLEIMYVSTHRHHRFCKLATLLCKTSIQLAKKLKYGPVATLSVKDLGEKYNFIPERKPLNKHPKLCQAIWTAEGTQKIGKALGFVVYASVPLKEYTFKGISYTERYGTEILCEIAALKI